jgi:hypothetical protein
MIGRCLSWGTSEASDAWRFDRAGRCGIEHSVGAGRTLSRLQQCYREIPPSGHQYVESPCASMRLRLFVLAGVARAQMEAALGPSWCIDAYEPSGKLKVRPKCLQPAWSFFYLPRSALGGGPNLVCWSLNGDTCLLLNWLLTA